MNSKSEFKIKQKGPFEKGWRNLEVFEAIENRIRKKFEEIASSEEFGSLLGGKKP